ncbi:MAG: DUF503 domain-containing protein [Dehalococcoidia bacterium]
MVTISVLVTIAIPEACSLKDKRQVVRSLVERLRVRRQLSAAEVGEQDEVRRGQVGFAVVSGSFAEARRLADEARRFVDAELLGKAEVIAMDIEECVLPSG